MRTLLAAYHELVVDYITSSYMLYNFNIKNILKPIIQIPTPWFHAVGLVLTAVNNDNLGISKYISKETNETLRWTILVLWQFSA